MEYTIYNPVTKRIVNKVLADRIEDVHLPSSNCEIRPSEFGARAPVIFSVWDEENQAWVSSLLSEGVTATCINEHTVIARQRKFADMVRHLQVVGLHAGREQLCAAINNDLANESITQQTADDLNALCKVLQEFNEANA